MFVAGELRYHICLVSWPSSLIPVTLSCFISFHFFAFSFLRPGAMALSAIADKIFNIKEGLRSSRKLPLGVGESIHSKTSHVKSLPWFGTPVGEEDDHEKSSGHGASDDGHSSIISHVPEGEPKLIQHHEASAIQLFYDLFFVANLCTFTGVHEVNDGASKYINVETRLRLLILTALKSYIGFFGVLWFTWLQVTLFHLRLGVDSAFERICKGLQFGVMTGFAVVGPAYKVDWSSANDAAFAIKAFKMLSIILMISRLVLAIQYAWALIHLRSYKRAILPLLIHVVILLITASVFLGLCFMINVDNTSRCLVGWYVTLGLESGAILLLAGNWKFLSFRRTNVVERISLLTLIILGEGIIGLCGSVQKTGNDQNWGPDIVGMIICGIVVIYAIFMLYFDQIEHIKVGTIRQQIWIMCHFPMHVTILFTVEGSAQLIIWRKLIDQWSGLRDGLAKIAAGISLSNVDDAGLQSLAENLNETFHSFYENFERGVNEMKYHPDIKLLHNNMQAIADLSTSDMTSPEIKNQTLDYIQETFASAAILAGKNMGVEAPHHFAHSDDVNDILDGLLDKTFGTVFTYFFVAAGLCILMTALLFVLGRRHKTKTDYANVAVRCFFGIGLALIATMNANDGTSPAFSNYAASPWMLPTVAIVFAVVVGADNVLKAWGKRAVAAAAARRRVDEEVSAWAAEA